WQLAREKRSDIPKEALMLPPVDLDVLLHNKLANPTLGGYYVYSSPCIVIGLSPFFLKSLIAHRRDAEHAKGDRKEIIQVLFHFVWVNRYHSLPLRRGEG
ncbi:MAG: hypothetical protein NTZ78_08895, partial [Candidatus Aureabacteria bacterium]|nr:hypothetical protein [Candidatus Auribacterota bacterium]